MFKLAKRFALKNFLYKAKIYKFCFGVSDKMVKSDGITCPFEGRCGKAETRNFNVVTAARPLRRDFACRKILFTAFGVVNS